MDLGLHTILDDNNSKLDPEVLAISEDVNENKASEFGRVWDLFQAKDTPFKTDEFEVLVRNYTPPQVSVTASAASTDWDTTGDSTALPVSPSDIDRITVGHVLKVESEIVVVKSVDRTGNTIDVYERGAGESSAAAHGTSAVTVTVVGNAHREGKVDGEAMAEGTSKFTNYLQLVEEIIDLSKVDTDQARKTGRTETTLKSEALERVLNNLSKTAIHGVSRAGTNSIPSMTRGLLEWLQLSGSLSTNVGGAFTQTSLDNLLNDVREKGGSVNYIAMSIANKKVFNTFTSADEIKQDVSERSVGRIIEQYLADGFGGIPVVVDIDMPNDKIVVGDSRKMKKGWKDNDTLEFVPENNTNSRENKETLQGKFGLSVENVGNSHALGTGLTT